MNTKVFIVSHKFLNFPKRKGYYPLQVGMCHKNYSGYIRDNTGDNIAAKNHSFCELTAMYWIWRNVNADCKGLVHYRRFFADSSVIFSINQKKKHIINIDKINSYLNQYNMIIPKKRYYYIETIWSHYKHSHKIISLIIVEMIIAEYYPEYLRSFKITMNKRSAHMFNMIIAQSEIFNKYCKWLFDILFKLEKRLNISTWPRSESRVYGYVGELLLDVWLRYHTNVSYKELPIAFTYHQHWIKKGYEFLMRKLTY